ncbi:MAG: hypothetical protein HY074_01400 [Deltaproteobacteria bacterium]|nr:hypothetical protein [Deltaproteobacteria bacterium]
MHETSSTTTKLELGRRLFSARSAAGDVLRPRLNHALPVASMESELELRRLVHVETQRMRALDAQPEATERRLLELAQGLVPPTISALAKLAMDVATPADEKFMAVYLIARAAAAEPAAAALAKVALSAAAGAAHGLQSAEAQLNPEKASFERVLRAQAIEGLSTLRESTLAKATLSRLAAEEPSKFIRARATLALRVLNGEEPVSLKERDEEQLAHLVNSKTTKSEKD